MKNDSAIRPIHMSSCGITKFIKKYCMMNTMPHVVNHRKFIIMPTHKQDFAHPASNVIWNLRVIWNTNPSAEIFGNWQRARMAQKRRLDLSPHPVEGQQILRDDLAVGSGAISNMLIQVALGKIRGHFKLLRQHTQPRWDVGRSMIHFLRQQQNVCDTTQAFNLKHSFYQQKWHACTVSTWPSL